MTGAHAEEATKAFVMMPFSTEFDDVHDVIQRAIRSVDAGLTPVRLDEVRAAGKISDDLVHEISTAALCIADVSGANPNVMWEVGFAAALRKPIIAINQSAESPFDIADVRSVVYERGSLSVTLEGPLTEAVRQTLARYSVSSTPLASRKRLARARSIAVTGTMECPPDKVRSRLEKVLGPFIGRNVAWCLGSFGVVDEVAARMLIETGETQITVVGYSSYDVSGPMLSILRSHEDVAFVDASSEQIPKVVGAPSERDVLLAARCDALVIGWDGISDGTRSLISWLASQRKDHYVCFVPPLYHEYSRPLVR